MSQSNSRLYLLMKYSPLKIPMTRKLEEKTIYQYASLVEKGMSHIHVLHPIGKVRIIILKTIDE